MIRLLAGPTGSAVAPATFDRNVPVPWPVSVASAAIDISTAAFDALENGVVATTGWCHMRASEMPA